MVGNMRKSVTFIAMATIEFGQTLHSGVSMSVNEHSHPGRDDRDVIVLSAFAVINTIDS